MGKNLERPIFFPVANLIVVIAEIFVNFDVFGFVVVNRFRRPAVGVRADVTGGTRSIIFDCTWGVVARVPLFAEVVNTGFFADGSSRSVVGRARSNGLGCCSDRNWSAGFAASDGGNCRNRKDSRRWTFADLSVLDDMDRFDFNNRFQVVRIRCNSARRGDESSKSCEDHGELHHDG
jgi:hypothetical protein